MKLCSLQIHKPDGTVENFSIHQAVLTIGRAANNDLVLADPECSVSRWHAKLTCSPDDASAMLADLNSVNGTFVNSQPLTAPVVIRSNDQIAIGKFRLLFREESPASWQWTIQTGTVELNELQKQTQLIKNAADKEFTTAAGLAHLELLHQVGVSLARTQSVVDVIRTSVEMLFKIEQVHRATTMLWDKDQQTFMGADLHIRGGKTVNAALTPHNPRQLVMSQTILKKVREENKPLLLRDTTSEASLGPSMSIVDAGIQAALCSPLTYQGRLLGVLYADNLINPNAFSETDFRTFTIIAAQTGLALAYAESREEILRREVESRALRLYLPPQIADSLTSEDNKGRLGGTLQPITVLFADIREFTHLSEYMDAQKVVFMLNQFFTLMSRIIYSHGGMLDKFIGDCVMALFGAPTPCEGAARQGLETAIEMQQEVKRLNAILTEANFPAIRIGVGLHTGPAVVGNIGSADRVQYTAIGDTVNVAARLVDLADDDEIILSEDTYKALENRYGFQCLGTVELRGRRQGLNIYSSHWDEGTTTAHAGQTQ